MAARLDIRRRFIVRDRDVVASRARTSMTEGYLIIQGDVSVCVRLLDTPRASIAFMGPRNGAARAVMEQDIDFELGEQLLRVCEPAVITKMRYPLSHGGMAWLVDVFLDANDGIVLATVGFDALDTSIDVPPWCGREVTEEVRYADEHLATHPYCLW